MILPWILFGVWVCDCRAGDVIEASVTYDEQNGQFSVFDRFIDGAVAHGTFQDEIFTTGWSYLEVHSSEAYQDSIQAYAAGLVEGHLTQDLIRKHWNNVAADYCVNEEEYCKRLKDYMQKNMDFVNEQIQAKRQTDYYWHQVALTLEQLNGLEDGYKNRIGKPSTTVDVMGLFLLHNLGDFHDLEPILDRKTKRVFGSAACSGLIKVLPNNEDVYFSHVTWTSYSVMLRILKKYSLKLHIDMSGVSPLVPGNTYVFSSYPGAIFSFDDYYQISSGLAAMETTLINYNMSLYQYVTPNGTVLEWQRSIVAHRLAKDGRQWAAEFGKMNSGTYNNQWMILDYNKFKPGEPLQDDFLHILEQMPGHIRSEDQTDVLRRQSYWASYNSAYYKDIYNMSGAQETTDKYGDFFSYEKTSRAQIFKREQCKVKDLPSMMKLMRYNNYKHDPLSRCNCTPPYSAENAISARSDLNPKSGTYELEVLGHRMEGGLDMKLTTSGLFKKLRFIATSGPTYDDLPPFQWSKAEFDPAVKHEGQPDLWKFDPIIHEWL